MMTYLCKRLLLMVPLLLGITLITFVVIHLAPGEPVEMQMAMNPKVSKAARQRMQEFYGLDKPLHVQYVAWLGRLTKFDFGRSFAPDNRPVVDKIKERIPVTLSLNLIALVIEFGLALPIGILAAVRRNSLLDKGLTVFVFLGFAMPTFWLALLLMYFFGVKLGWLPISGLHSLEVEHGQAAQLAEGYREAGIDHSIHGRRQDRNREGKVAQLEVEIGLFGVDGDITRNYGHFLETIAAPHFPNLTNRHKLCEKKRGVI